MIANALTFPPLVYAAMVLLALVCGAIFTAAITRDSAMTAHAIKSTHDYHWFTRLCRWCVGIRRN
jgi:hypothetical protein